ncbi:hypothetical protein ACQUY5_29280 [Bacillus cereus]|uniref:hypothetical protein n=1 Tax=Bacillus cereus TaxID=1396 RepID=UPI003D1735FF
MEKTAITINFDNQTLEVGTLHNLMHGGTTFEIPHLQEFGETGAIMITGLQYVEFADYLILIEAHTEDNFEFFLLDIRDFNTNGSFTKPYELPKFKGGYKGFNKLVAERLN